jgi:hypothetical protein
MRPRVPPITEAAFLRQVLDLAKLRGWRTAHFRPAQTSRGWRTAVQGDGAGFPDLVLLRGGHMIVAEVKRGPKFKPTAAQCAWLAAFLEIDAPNVMVAVWTPDDWAMIERLLA